MQIWRHRGTQPTRARPEAEGGGQWEHLYNYLSSLAEKGRNAAAMLPASQTSSSRTAWNPPRYARMHWWTRKHAQFVNHDGMHHFGSASETVAFCANAALFEPSVTTVERRSEEKVQ